MSCLLRILVSSAAVIAGNVEGVPSRHHDSCSLSMADDLRGRGKGSRSQPRRRSGLTPGARDQAWTPLRANDGITCGTAAECGGVEKGEAQAARPYAPRARTETFALPLMAASLAYTNSRCGPPWGWPAWV